MNKRMFFALCFMLGSTAIFAQNTNTTPAPAEPKVVGTLKLINNQTFIMKGQLEKGTITVEDVTRRNVTKAIIVVNEQDETLIDFSNLPSGTYYAKGTHNNTKVFYKVVKP